MGMGKQQLDRNLDRMVKVVWLEREVKPDYRRRRNVRMGIKTKRRKKEEVKKEREGECSVN